MEKPVFQSWALKEIKYGHLDLSKLWNVEKTFIYGLYGGRILDDWGLPVDVIVIPNKNPKFWYIDRLGMLSSKVHNFKNTNLNVLKLWQICLDNVRNQANQESNQSVFSTESYDFYNSGDKPKKFTT